jgi:signal transduction histidine kinase
VAVEKASLSANLRERESRVARLLEAAMNAQETERRRIADEMHDGLSQALTGLHLQAEIAKITLERTAPPEALAAVELIQEAIRRASEELRDVVFKVCPPSVDGRGLVANLEAMVDEVCSDSSLEGRVDDRAGRGRLPGAVETILYGVAQEALRDVVRKGDARRLWVKLERNAEEACLSVRDDGRGVHRLSSLQPATEPRPGTTDLDSVRDRLALAGGSVDIVALPEGGTQVSARIPLTAFR